ncbi:MAG: aminotransferase class I/II-fold pyridoxal phosphate-dependent enzyme [Candidatus Coatesbacteria bacterium]|nr:aminotransferase class I/II-fold pyridoxal phosphate-dependent enzyme [Candidatus Coatesbacteria bacterium]
MPKIEIDLRSDTVTRPDEPMRRAMYEAEVGDDVLGDDPTVKRLEERYAELVGKQAALFTPSGSMANQIAVAAWTRGGDEIICGAQCHILEYEYGAPAFLARVLVREVPTLRGAPDPAAVAAAYKSGAFHSSRTSLLCLENTHNRLGGLIADQELFLSLRRFADKRKVKIHLDGARLWNAHAATGKTMAELAAPADSVMSCLSKGLACPVGSILAGPADFIEETHRLRKICGGGMRQVGILAAAGLHALEHNVTRLAEDHAHARRLAEVLAAADWAEIDPADVHTNIIIPRLKGVEPGRIVEAAAAQGLAFFAFGPDKLRLVTHKDVDSEQIERAGEILARLSFR